MIEILKSQFFLQAFSTAILIAVIWYAIKKMGLLETNDPTGADINEVESLPEVSPGFNAKNEAVAIHDTLMEWDYLVNDKIAAFRRMLDYNENELIGVHNAYRRAYKNSDYPTLRRLVQGESIFILNGGFNVAYELKREVLTYLSQIGA